MLWVIWLVDALLLLEHDPLLSSIKILLDLLLQFLWSRLGVYYLPVAVDVASCNLLLPTSDGSEVLVHHITELDLSFVSGDIHFCCQSINHFIQHTRFLIHIIVTGVIGIDVAVLLLLSEDVPLIECRT